MLRTPALPRELDAAGDDQDRSCEQRRPDRLAEEDEGDRDRDERRRAEDDGRARGAGLPDRESHEQLPGAGLKHARQRERPRAGDVQPARRGLGRGGHERDGERAGDGRERRERGVRPPREAHAQADAHRPEEQGGGEGERDRGHAPGRYSSGWRASSASGARLRAGARASSGMKTCASGPIETA